MFNYLDNIRFDWNNFIDTGKQSRELATRLGQNKKMLRELVYGLEDKPDLLAMCERHQLLDYLVIYDATDRGFRIRLNITTESAKDRPHDHRFSFSTYIIKGQYKTVIHQGDDGFYEKSRIEAAKNYQDRFHPDINKKINLGQINPAFVRMEREGTAYTLHHKMVHSVVTTPDTVSLFIRGPAEKDRSIIFDRETNSYWWRFGHNNETEDRRNEKVMSKNDYIEIRQKLEKMEII